MVKQIASFMQDFNGLSPINLRSFWISFITVALVVMLSKLGLRPPEFFNLPQSMDFKLVSSEAKRVDVLDAIKPKLEQKPNQYKIKQTTSFISVTKASGEYDNATAYGVIDYETGAVLAEKNLDTPTSIASLTKIMTAVVALDLASPQEKFTVSQAASEIIPTKIGVEVGEKLTLEELINALMLTSANDAAEVIKEGIDQKYGEKVFMKAMNEKARVLNLDDSKFTNPQGFDHPSHLSSVEDLAVLSHYAIENYPLIAEVAKKDYQYYGANENRGQMDLYNWNGLLGVYPGAFGLKIGNTELAQYTTIVGAQREGKKVLVVMLGAPGVLERDLWTAELLDIGFEKLGMLPINIDETMLREKYSSWQYWN